MGRSVLFGVVATLVLEGLIVAFIVLTGPISMRADMRPSPLESNLAMRMVDANLGRNAPNVPNPMSASDANLVAGATLYHNNCAVCHGDPAHPQSRLADTMYPPPPQFMTDAADSNDNKNYYIVVHGIRWTGMPGWKNALTDQQIWQVVGFLSHMANLPPAAQAVFNPR